MANESIYAAFERMWSHVKALVKDVKKYVDDSVANAGGGGNISFADEAPTASDMADGEVRFVAAEADYEELKSIIATNSQAFNTHFVPNQDTRIVIRAKLLTEGSNCFLFGVRASSTSKTFAFNRYSNKYRTHYNTTYSDFDASVSYTEPFVIDKNKNVTTINGEHVIEQTYSSFTCPAELYLFALNNNGTVSQHVDAEVEEVMIYDNGILVRHYVPRRRKSDGVVGLYDKVNNTFGGSTTSTAFEAGEVLGEFASEGARAFFKHNNVLQMIGGAGGKIATGTYTGTGKAGESNPNSLTFSFVPKFLIVYASEAGTGAFVFMHPTSDSYTSEETYGIRAPSSSVTALGQGNFYAKVSGTTISWYHTSAGTQYYFQMNSADTVYHYIAFLE